MRLPVDTSVMHFVSAGPAEPSVDFDTKQQKTRRQRRRHQPGPPLRRGRRRDP